MKKILPWITTILVFFLTDILFCQNIVINEILASNASSIKDEDGNNNDWIELYNSGGAAVNLSGFGLSDDPLLPFKWKFPNMTLNKGEYLLVWASDKNRATAGSPLHTNFKISASGNNILLTSPSGTVVDQVPPVNLQLDISFGRFPNGNGAFVYFGTPTPNAVNSTAGFSESLSPPDFTVNGISQKSGFYQTGFDLILSTKNAGATILYTLDGSEPDEKNLSGTTYRYKNQYPQKPGQAFGPFLALNSFKTIQYSGVIPITDRSSQPNKVSNISSTYDFNPAYLPNGPIFKGTVVKAKAIKPGALSSITVTKNYFISPKGPNRFTIPVLSISTDDNQLFDYDQGIYVAGVDFDNWRTENPNGEAYYHGANFGRLNIEKVVSMNYFVNGEETINQKVGIQIHGAASRIFPQKSIDLHSRADYGDNKMSYKFFKDEPYTSYERLTVRNYGSADYNIMFTDPLCIELSKDLQMETEAYQPIVTFINGEYWGLFALREKCDKNYFKQVYDIPGSQIDLLENQGEVKAGDTEDYNNFYTYIQNNSLAGSSNFSTIQTRMDINNFTDYFVTNIFFNNRNWPEHNIYYWRKKTTVYQSDAPYGHDGRWRWALHDMDGTLKDPAVNTLERVLNLNGSDSSSSDFSALILKKLLENSVFKIDFLNRFADLMNTNFLSDRITAKIDSMTAELAPEMNDQYYRWKAPINDGDWQYFLNRTKDFAKQRPEIQRNHLKQKFGISKSINTTLDVSDIAHGYIKINTIKIIDGTPGISGNPYPWTGIYFDNIPVKLKAIANPGFVFDHWTGASNSTQEEITITPTENFSIKAVFVPAGNLTIDNTDLKKFKIYPNPFHDLINVSGINTNISYKIFSMDRKLIKSENNTTSPIDLSGLPIGTYVLQLSSANIIENCIIIKK